MENGEWRYVCLQNVINKVQTIHIHIYLRYRIARGRKFVPPLAPTPAAPLEVNLTVLT